MNPATVAAEHKFPTYEETRGSLSSAPRGAKAQAVIFWGGGANGGNLDANGNFNLGASAGHCWGNVSPMPTSSGITFNGGTGVTAGPGVPGVLGGLAMGGAITFNSSTFPGDIVFHAPSGAAIASITSAGAMYLAGRCLLASGCSNTTWEPSKWNDQGTVQYNNNCYNYANDKITNTNAQPGRGSGFPNSNPWDPSNITVYNIQEATLNDGLLFVGWTFPGNTYDCGNGHLVYMAVWDYEDFHFWRVDQTGLGAWSHKAGSISAQNVDWNGNTITNPLTSNVGQYTDNGGFYCTCGGSVNIN
jgi:hypothetical protein